MFVEFQSAGQKSGERVGRDQSLTTLQEKHPVKFLCIFVLLKMPGVLRSGSTPSCSHRRAQRVPPCHCHTCRRCQKVRYNINIHQICFMKLAKSKSRTSFWSPNDDLRIGQTASEWISRLLLRGELRPGLHQLDITIKEQTVKQLVYSFGRTRAAVLSPCFEGLQESWSSMEQLHSDGWMVEVPAWLVIQWISCSVPSEFQALSGGSSVPTL